MRTIILLTILAVLPIFCRFYLDRKLVGDDEAVQIAQKILDTILIAYKNRDVDLFLSLFDKSLTLVQCGRTIKYAEFEKITRKAAAENPAETLILRVENAEIQGEYLKFDFVETSHTVLHMDKITAVRTGEGFKISNILVGETKCKGQFVGF